MSEEKREDLSAYEAWLKKQGYQEATIIVTLRHIQTIMPRLRKTVETELPASYKSAVQRYLRYMRETDRRDSVVSRLIAKYAKEHALEAARETIKSGSRVKEVLDKKQLAKLRTKLASGDALDRLLWAYTFSVLRVSAFLTLRKGDIDKDSVLDKRARSWLRDRLGRKKVFEVVCESERCTYARLRRRLQILSEELGIEVDLDTLYKTTRDAA